MTDPDHDLADQLKTPLVEDRDVDFVLPFQRKVRRERRHSLLIGLAWQTVIAACIGLLVTAVAVGAIYLLRLATA
jgi:hypothetical protein